MTVTTDSSLSPYDTYNNPASLIQHLLQQIVATPPVEYACVVSSGERKRAEHVADCAGPDVPPGSEPAIFGLLSRHLQTLNVHTEPEALHRDTLKGTDFRSGWVFPLIVADEVLGLVGLFSREKGPWDDTTLVQLGPPVALIRALLENMHMYNVLAQNLIVTQSIQLAAKEIANNPSPQHVVNILRDYFFDAHVTSCAMLLFGPVSEDRPDGPFEYLEVKGTWSKRRGSGVGVGVRFYLNDLTDLLDQLDREEILVFPRAKDLSVRLDPLIRIFLQAERVRSLCLVHLRASGRRLGIIFVGADARHEFSAQELHSYRTVSEFLAINVMTQMLQLEHDRVMQGRAALLDAVTDGVIMVLPSPQGARVLTVNQRLSDLFGLPDDLDDWLLADVLAKLPLSEQDREELGQMWLTVPVRDPSTQKGEFHLINDAGQPLDIEWYSAPVYQEQQVLGRIYILHDVTAERTAQRLRSAFLSRVSHELRTPLTSIRGFAEFILEATGDELPDLAREYTEIILSSAKHLNRVFTDMIEITRADAGELKLNRHQANIADVIIDVVSRMELMYKQRQQRVIMDLDDDLPPVSVDNDRMIQVLTNLMTNAIKYSPDKGTIRIRTTYVARQKDLPPGAPDDMILPAVLVEVRDEGKGLSKEDAERVFMPFYRTEQVKKDKIEGVGLGLAVTRSIVEMHRGKIWAEVMSKDTTGGKFLFTVPTVER